MIDIIQLNDVGNNCKSLCQQQQIKRTRNTNVKYGDLIRVENIVNLAYCKIKKCESIVKRSDNNMNREYFN